MTDRSRWAASAFVNPYRTPSGDRRVSGVTAGRFGLAAGVIAVATVSPAGAAEGSVPGDTHIWFGTALTVAQEIRENDPGSGYLWPGPPAAGSLASPALEV